MSTPGPGGALGNWRRQLEAWRIPDPILSAAPESPWGFPPELFVRRAERAAAEPPPTPTTRRALEALSLAGSVLDVGCGGGATSLPLAARAGLFTGVDAQPDMVEAFREAVGASSVTVRTVTGAWPEVAGGVDPADVVICGHVLYNVADAGPFLDALHRHARRRVVLEITAKHPLSWMNDLWERFHGLARPLGPSAEDALAAIDEMGFAPRSEHGWAPDEHPAGGGFLRREDAVALVRRRLCLTSDRDEDVAAALGDRLRDLGGLWSAGPEEQELVTIWWDPPADG